MSATLIWDNAAPATLLVPPEMGTPAANQLQGSPWDNLCELAGRVAYDSLGRGRSSEEYHAHIREVGHLSVYEHATFTVALSGCLRATIFLNRSSLWVRRVDNEWRVTLNLRHVLEWDRWSVERSALDSYRLMRLSARLLPLASPNANKIDNDIYAVHVLPETPEERWLTFFITGVSRGCANELIRHRAYTAVSQRSTRYCDESKSLWVPHPLIERVSARTQGSLTHVASEARSAYCRVVEDLIGQGHDRKAARGAARGVLGNALATELIFSASLAQWRRIVALRNHPSADGEIRVLAAEIESQLP